MEFPERFSARLTRIIANTLTDLSEDKLEQINYGIAVLIANSYKYIFIFLAAYLLKVFDYMLITLFSFGLLRTFAAGLHGSREWTCFASTTAFVFGTIYLSLNLNMNIYLLTGVFIICLFAVYRFAPSDTEERPIYSKSYRRKMKLLSCLAVTALYVLSVRYYGTAVSNICTITTVAEVILIIPVSYKLTNSVYGTGLNMNKEEV